MLRLRLSYVVAVLGLAGGVALARAPLKSPPKLLYAAAAGSANAADAAPLRDGSIASKGALSGDNPRGVEDVRFDLSLLPPEEAPPQPAPPPDPSLGLKQYSFLGSARSGASARAIFEGPAGVVSLSEGGELAGFALKSFDARSARFEQGGLAVELSLGVKN